MDAMQVLILCHHKFYRSALLVQKLFYPHGRSGMFDQELCQILHKLDTDVLHKLPQFFCHHRSDKFFFLPFEPNNNLYLELYIEKSPRPIIITEHSNKILFKIARPVRNSHKFLIKKPLEDL
jgi:hypothetical protein